MLPPFPTRGYFVSSPLRNTFSPRESEASQRRCDRTSSKLWSLRCPEQQRGRYLGVVLLSETRHPLLPNEDQRMLENKCA